jgi:hypothetical protein
MSYSPGKYDKNAMKKFDDALKAQKKLEKELKEKEQRRLEQIKYEEQKEIRHKEWLNKGQAYYDKMVAQELKLELAEEYRLNQLALRKKEAEEQQRRVKEKYRKRMEEERRKKEAEEALIASRTRWYDDGSRYEGDFLEDEFYENGTNLNDRRNKHRTPHGKGTFFVGTTERYSGDYFYGERHGDGKLICPDGSIYIGKFYKSERHGAAIWAKMTAEAIERKRIAKEKAMKEAENVTEIFTLPPRKVIFEYDTIVCWWDELVPGRLIEICITNSYNVHAIPRWYPCTIVDRRGHVPYVPSDSWDSEYKKKGQKKGGQRRPKKPERIKTKEEEEEEEPWVEPERHLIQCSNGAPWARPRWVNLEQQRFRMSLQRNYSHLPEALGRCERDSEVDHTSDPLSKAFKAHIKFKLESYSRYKTVERDLDDGNNGNAGGGKRSNFPSIVKTTQKWQTLLGGR